MISAQKKPYADSETFAILNPIVRNWFKAKFGSFSPPQTYSIMNIHKKENTLVSSPSGSGKTLSAFTSILNELINLSEKNTLEDKTYCVYISPLRALSNDIFRNLIEPLAEMEEQAGHKFGIRVAVRTGDTTIKERVRMAKKPPHILITTPESLAIILVSPKFRLCFKDVHWVIIDELHALADNKRGVHLSLSLERLQNLAGNFTRIGLSATVAPLEQMAKWLVGLNPDGSYRDCKIVDVQFLKRLDLKVLSPVANIMSATHEQLHNTMYKLLDNLIQQHNTTLIFTNTRAGTERVVHHLKTRFPRHYINLDKETDAIESSIEAHHGSLSREHRFALEKRLREGKLKAVVCSTSLELGIDIGDIDLVILLGSPKSIARALQRVGRSGHRLKDTVKGRFIVMDRDDLVECSLILKNAVEQKIDKITVPQNCLDVLAQQIYGIAIEDVNHVDNIFSLVKRSYCYRNLSREDFNDVIRYLVGDYPGLENRHVYGKIWLDPETKEIGRRGRLARVIHVTNIGTIPDESFISVKVGARRIGRIDEGFLERLKKGDVFVLGGNTYQYSYARGMTIQVRPVPEKVPTVPSWFSEMLPLSFDLGMNIQRFRRLMEDKFRARKKKEEIMEFIHDYLYVDDKAASSIYNYLKEQFKYAEIPHDCKLLIEHTEVEGTHYTVVHSCYGRRTNDALSRAVAYAIGKSRWRNISIGLTDNAFVLRYNGEKGWVKKAYEVLTKEDLRTVLINGIERTEVLKRRFRHCAARSLMILRTYKGMRKSAGRQQISAQILLNAVREIDDNFPILREARREVLEDLMDVEHAKQVLNGVKDNKIEIKEIHTQIPSPFALNVAARGYSDVMKMEDKTEFIRRMHNAVLVKIALKEKR